MEDIRLRTCCIVERDGLYLMGMKCLLRWTDSPWNAWMTRNKGNAERVAQKLRGRIMLFNPISGQLGYLSSGDKDRPAGRQEAFRR